ncbi:MAG: Asp-tRNA(Asn)/Glu-tRNA(Gln) amidotransferase subunit GatB, partial [Dehalococcoidales bacterium]|nr:Asp-tRNA(Asn)/Glu-tRNA(Gln) amidotransferase subunit GatB [Dehalococcoidales bacterium]
TRVHLEEDVAKLLHRTSPDGEAYSLVDVNRSGVPLMEIVGEPDLRSPEEARQYLIKLRGILQYLGVSTANMEEGGFRCDANISIRPEGSRPDLSGTKVEVKNMNSFRAVYRAMEYEARRQRRVAEAGERLIQETRGWVEEKGQTVSQRTKEYAHDYRYFPEPDLPPLALDRKWVEEIKAKLPELPEAKRDRFMAEYGLPLYDADLLTTSKGMADYFEDSVKVSKDTKPKEISNWLLGEASRIINANNINIQEFRGRVEPAQTTRIAKLNSEGVVNTSTAKLVYVKMFDTGKPAEVIIEELGLSQISDTQELEKIVTEVINSNPQAVSDYRAGKETAIKFLVGQVMKATRGRANPQMVNELLKKKLAGE